MRTARIGSAWPYCLAAVFLLGCATVKECPTGDDAGRTSLDRSLAGMVTKGDLEKAQRISDSLSHSQQAAEREIGVYWKAVAWLYRDEPDSALALLEANQGKWAGGMHRVHAALFLSLARESSQARAMSRARLTEAVRSAPTPDKSLQERLESLQKEAGDLRTENARLESQKEKYQKLLKDLETIR